MLARCWGLRPPADRVLFRLREFLANIGSIGGLWWVSSSFGRGYAYVFLYKLFEEVVYFVIGFPIAKHFSVAPGGPKAESAAVRLKTVLGDLFIVSAIASIPGRGC